MPKHLPNLRSVVDVVKAAEPGGDIPTRIQVVPFGKWKTTPYGTIEFTREHAEEMVRNFDAQVRVTPLPIDCDHMGMEAYGWMKKLEVDSDGLYADVTWTKEGSRRLAEREYTRLSPEFSLEYTDPLNSQEHGAVLIAAALTNRPLFNTTIKELVKANDSDGSHEVLLLSQVVRTNSQSPKEASVNITEILAKEPADLTGRELEFLKAHASELDDTAKAKFADALDSNADAPMVDPQPPVSEEPGSAPSEDGTTPPVDGNKPDESVAADDKPSEETPAVEDKPEETPVETPTPAPTEDEKPAEDNAETVTANDGTTINAAELAKLREDSQKLKRMEFTELAREKYLKASDGKVKLAPKAKDVVVDFLMSLTADQRKQFDDIMASVQPFSITASGSDEDSVLGADRINQLALSKVKASDGKLKYAEAVELVRSENPGLFEQYDQESK